MRKFTISLFIMFFCAGGGFAAEESKYKIFDGVEMFPHESIAKPLKADPLTPRMSWGYNYYTSRVYTLRNAMDFAIGGAFPAARKKFGDTTVEISLQGLGLLSFDQEWESDQLYSDFWFGMPVYIQLTSNLTFMFRVYHRSPHIGDETVLRITRSERITTDPNTGETIVIPPGEPNPNGPNDNNETSRVVYDIERINLSYEALGTLLSYQINDTFRIYGGGDWLARMEPYYYGSFIYQAGAEAEYLFSHSSGLMFICACDFKGTSRIAPGISVKTGVRAFDKVSVTFNFYDGPGLAQFFEQRVTSYGISFDIY